jgi:hypothetical protein
MLVFGNWVRASRVRDAANAGTERRVITNSRRLVGSEGTGETPARSGFRGQSVSPKGQGVKRVDES